jgi:hypothetical protein
MSVEIKMIRVFRAEAFAIDPSFDKAITAFDLYRTSTRMSTGPGELTSMAVDQLALTARLPA